MANPYEPPLSPEVASSSTSSRVPTRNQRMLAVFALSLGSVIGLNLSVAFDEGMASAIRRTAGDPLGALFFFTCVGVVCSSIVWVWTLIRRQVLAKYYAPAPVRFAAGILLTFSEYQILMYAERARIDFLTAVGVALFATTVVVVECEAFVTKVLGLELH